MRSRMTVNGIVANRVRAIDGRGGVSCGSTRSRSVKIRPHEVNVVVEVPVGGEPIKYEMDKAAGTLVVDRFLLHVDALPGELRLHPAHALGRRRPLRRADRQSARHRARRDRRGAAGRRAAMQDEAGGDEKIIAVPVTRLDRATKTCGTIPTCRRSRSADRTSSRTTKISSPANGSRSWAGATPPKPSG